MKKGIERYPEYDQKGRWMLVITKKRGKLTLEEIKDAARDWDLDYYALVLDCYHDESSYQGWGDETFDGDYVELYRIDALLDEDRR